MFRASAGRLAFAFACLVQCTSVVRAEAPIDTYRALQRFEFSGQTARAENLVLRRDRVTMTFDGVFHLEKPVAGRIRGAVFLGKGTIAADAPPVEFERENVRRMLKADAVQSDFQVAVLRFSDDTDREIAARTAPAEPPSDARHEAEQFSPRLLKETGANLSARTAISILNGESPGFFAASFDKGRRGRFTFVLDQQGRIPSATFGVNAGESGLIFAHRGVLSGNDIWLAFHTLNDYERRQVRYSDAFDLVAIRHYAMEIDVREASKKKLGITARMEAEPLIGGVQAIPFLLNEGLGEFQSERLKRAMRVSGVKSGTADVRFAQEDWEAGFTVFLPNPVGPGEKLALGVDAAGEFILTPGDAEIQDIGYWGNVRPEGVFYPRVNTSWYPRHGYLRRSTYELRFQHKRNDLIAGPGMRISEKKDGDAVTIYSVDAPVAFVTFGAGDLKRHTREADNTTIEYYALSADKQDFMLTELSNTVSYFSDLFGAYRWKALRASFHPRPFGQGLPSLLLLAPTGHSTNKYEFSFIAHEMAHQWWGDLVGWRSYRDQWLSEGFAQYSGAMYTAVRMNVDAEKDMIRRMRRILQAPPVTENGVRTGKVAEIGPIILGGRLVTRETRNAYQALIYEKGALVLRMLHFLLSDPQTGDDRAFYQMLSEFVIRNQGKEATTESFREVASVYFARSPIAKQYRVADLGWFFKQWIYQAYLPSYHMEYRLETQPDNTVMLRGTVYQKNAGEKWFMPIPIVMQFGNGQYARGSVAALGEQANFTIKLPQRPTEVQLDPDLWVLSEDTTTSAVKN